MAGRPSRYFSAAAFITAIDRARLKPLSSFVLAVNIRIRNSTGSTEAAAAISSMKDSEANVTCGPSGSLRLPVLTGVSHTSGSAMTCVLARRFGMTYISEGVDARPAAGVAFRMPAS